MDNNSEYWGGYTIGGSLLHICRPNRKTPCGQILDQAWLIPDEIVKTSACCKRCVRITRENANGH